MASILFGLVVLALALWALNAFTKVNPHTAAAVKSFIGRLEPQTQSAVMGACETFMQDPTSVSSPDTLGFCASAVRG